MLLFISGIDGSTIYSFFSVNFKFATGEGGDTEGEYGNGISFSSEPRLEASTDTGPKNSPTDPLSEPLSKRSSSRTALILCSLGGTTMTSKGRLPSASTQLTWAPAVIRSLTASTTLTDPPEAAQ
ncbi:hypothetical protein KIW84_044935 [Lathyrus oleraceus]|uniref:Uncharacterized protein n=1 Tax=Pisum sativum TaxID=3888 RepID=A0A9D5AWK1_PEA|nr:hypothetical protein KIW84_044935 [Pisum sativum]